MYFVVLLILLLQYQENVVFSFAFCHPVSTTSTTSTGTRSHHHGRVQSSTMRTATTTTATATTATYFLPTPPGISKSREVVQAYMDEKIMPKELYSERIGVGRDAHGIGNNSDGCDDDGNDDDEEELLVINANDPRLERTYAEFPLPSLDQLIDLSFKYFKTLSKDDDGDDSDEDFTFVDIGSGCGRILLYLALSRKGIPMTTTGEIGSDNINKKNWSIHGIEVSDKLHGQAIQYLERVLEDMSLEQLTTKDTSTNENSNNNNNNNDYNSVSFHLGPVKDYTQILGEADMIFAYSTAFNAKSFVPEISALVLDAEWSCLLSQSCKNGCVAITTDRALDPKYGWKLVNRLDVENPEVFGSTGYIHVLSK